MSKIIDVLTSQRKTISTTIPKSNQQSESMSAANIRDSNIRSSLPQGDLLCSNEHNNKVRKFTLTDSINQLNKIEEEQNQIDINDFDSKNIMTLVPKHSLIDNLQISNITNDTILDNDDCTYNKVLTYDCTTIQKKKNSIRLNGEEIAKSKLDTKLKEGKPKPNPNNSCEKNLEKIETIKEECDLNIESGLENQLDERFCRICKEDESFDETNENILISMCKCTGI